VLWTHPKHELVTRVGKQILEKYRDLANEISTGDLFVSDRLEEILNELGPGGPQVLAAVLWALELKGPGAELLFRSLVPLVHTQPLKGPETDRAVSYHGREAKSARAKLRTALRERERAERIAKKVSARLRSRERALARVKQEREELQHEYDELKDVFDVVERKLRDSEASHRDLERVADQTSEVNSALRKDLHDVRRERDGLEVTRSNLALQLATERRTIEHLKSQLATVPRGTEAVEVFLCEEEERVNTLRRISSGGDKIRADEEWSVHRKLRNAFLDAYPRYRQPPPTKIRPKTPARLVALGGSAEIGRSCYLLELGKHRVLVDCGIKPSASDDLHPAIESLERVDALILTHAHTDHIGWVPALIRRFPEVGIYCSEGTAALLPVMLDDCHQHYRRKISAQRERARYIANAARVEQQYEAQDVHNVPNLVIKCLFHQEELLRFGDMSVVFYPAGHILGAASVLIQDRSGRRVFFSGDISSFPQLTVQAADWPPEIGPVDLLVLESTYGGREHRPLDESRRELISFVRKTLEGEGSVILASFGLGRAQELLKLIGGAQDDGELPPATVYMDGMIRQINPIFSKHANFELSHKRFHEVSGDSDRQDVAALAQTTPSIIVTTSGMLTGGPVLHYAQQLLPDPRHRIVLTGYQDEGAPSRALRELATGRRLVTLEDERGEKTEFEAAMPAKEIGLSSHADRPGLLRYASLVRSKKIALVHGDPAGQEVLRRHLLRGRPSSDVICGPNDLVL
jgi:Cft2 family RNA processing exonuclease